ncbi:hypothetical protein [Actinophytocola glycyrrhizae]|uniref:Uncharacterized protein n=1 Tax=Actinophytocola glycyrrhizae TaxID=2044873 RepID=A0ABV9S2H9_9PSEU
MVAVITGTLLGLLIIVAVVVRLSGRWSVPGTGGRMVAVITGTLLGLLIIVAVVVRLSGRWSVPGTGGRALRWFAVAATVAIVVALLPRTLSDSGGATVYLLGVPLLAAVAVAVADATGRAVGTVTAVAALAMLVWGLLLGLGYGAYFLLPGLILAVAVLANVRPRAETNSAPG